MHQVQFNLPDMAQSPLAGVVLGITKAESQPVGPVPAHRDYPARAGGLQIGTRPKRPDRFSFNYGAK